MFVHVLRFIHIILKYITIIVVFSQLWQTFFCYQSTKYRIAQKRIIRCRSNFIIIRVNLRFDIMTYNFNGGQKCFQKTYQQKQIDTISTPYSFESLWWYKNIYMQLKLVWNTRRKFNFDLWLSGLPGEICLIISKDNQCMIHFYKLYFCQICQLSLPQKWNCFTATTFLRYSGNWS